MALPLTQPRSRHQLIGASLGVLCLLAGTEALWFRNITRLVSTLTWVDQQSRLVAVLDESLSDAGDAEAAQREFTITGDPMRLRTFDDERVRVTDRMRLALRLAEPDTAHMARVRELAALLGDAFASMRQTIDLREDGDVRGASARAESAEEKDRMERIRGAVAGLDGSVHAAVNEKRLNSSEEVGRTVAITGLAFVVAFGIAGRAVVRLEREIGRRREAEHRAIEAKEEAERSSRAKSEFLTHVSHELRTPLNSVIGFSNVLLRKTGGQEAVYLERIRANGTHLLSLINDLLDLSKIEAGKERLELSEVSLDRLIAETVRELEGRLVGKQVVLETDVPSGLAPLSTDERKLKQVLINLIGNALKFTEEGRVIVRVIADPESSIPQRIDVVDTGIGIAAERQAAIFEAFEQADRGAARRYGGTGLGLSIAQSFCQLMGYRLSVASVVDKGSTFSVLLRPMPLVAAPPAVSAPSASVSPRPSLASR
jgi:signal transduction histidine kinase